MWAEGNELSAIFDEAENREASGRGVGAPLTESGRFNIFYAVPARQGLKKTGQAGWTNKIMTHELTDEQIKALLKSGEYPKLFPQEIDRMCEDVSLGEMV